MCPAEAAYAPNAAEVAEISVYEDHVPDFAGPALDRLYGILYSSLSYFRTCGDLADVSTYVARREGIVSAIFLFRREEATIRVLNEGMRLPSDELARFVRHIFAAYPESRAIVCHAVQVNGGKLPFVHHRSFCAEDFIVRLPQTQEAYIARLGPATRKNIKRHKNRLERDFPSLQWHVQNGREADEDHIRRIIDLNRMRMEKKGMRSYIDEEETKKIVRLVQQCGDVQSVMIDGRLCGGTLFYRIGRNHISKVNAHDPAYDSYRLGMICCYLAVCDAIARSAEHFHLGSTYYEYKTALLGEFEKFDHVVIYRSPILLFRRGPAAIKEILSGQALQLNRWILRNVDRDKRPLWRIARKALDAYRAMKKRRHE